MIKENHKMRIMVISAIPWNTNNNFGNSYANIFDGMEKLEISNIYFSEGEIDDNNVSGGFRITPMEIAKNLISKKSKVGKRVSVVNQQAAVLTNCKEPAKKINEFAQRHKLFIFHLMRDFFWRIGRWNTPELQSYIKEFDPDLFFIPINGNCYMNRIANKIIKDWDVPVVGYVSDDNYTLRQLKISPLFWIRRFCLRFYVKKVDDQCEKLYVISDIQKRDYDKAFKTECDILTKGKNFKELKPQNKEFQEPYHLLFTGNITSNRWKSLSVIGKAIDNINKDRQFFDLTIYTNSQITREMAQRFGSEKSVRIAGSIPSYKVSEKQAEADILVHVEPTDIRYSWTAYHGFSTKLVDYMAANRPILAYGLETQASISHLKENKAAMIASTQSEVEFWLKKILEDSSVLQYYADQGWKCGAAHHDINKIHEMLEADFQEVISK